MSGFKVLLSVALMSLLPFTVVCLTCYECTFSVISPLECLSLSTKKCEAGERCLSSTAIAMKDSARVMLKEKNCSKVSRCGVSGTKKLAGLVFTYTTHCCDTNLCNAATQPSNPWWCPMTLSLIGTTVTILLVSE